MRDIIISKNLWVLAALCVLWYLFGSQDVRISLAITIISAVYSVTLLIMTKDDRSDNEACRSVEAIMFTIFLCLLSICYIYKDDMPQMLFYMLASLVNGFVISIFIGPMFGRR